MTENEIARHIFLDGLFHNRGAATKKALCAHQASFFDWWDSRYGGPVPMILIPKQKHMGEDKPLDNPDVKPCWTLKFKTSSLNWALKWICSLHTPCSWPRAAV